MQSKLKLLLLAFAFVCAVSAYSQDKPAPVSPDFNAVADKALAAMKARAEELHINGAAVVAYSKSDPVLEWSSKMVAVGSITPPCECPCAPKHVFACRPLAPPVSLRFCAEFGFWISDSHGEYSGYGISGLPRKKNGRKCSCKIL